MAEGTSLKLKFDTSRGSRTFTFRNAKQSAGLNNLKNLANVMIANGEIYTYRPLAVTDIREVTTTEVVYNLDG